MMDELVKLAIVGTAQQSNQQLQSGTTLDTLLEQCTEASLERKLLLLSSFQAIYQGAGYTARPELVAMPEAAPEQTRTCSGNIAALLRSMLDGKNGAWLEQALLMLQERHLRLPFDLLPKVLDYGKKHPEARALIDTLLGERGRWLSRYNPAWQWVQEYAQEQEAATQPVSEKTWQDGSNTERQELLSRQREADPDKARIWLAETWSQEKADTRARLLKTFKINQSQADIPFLEQVLNGDRSESVRFVAAQLLAALPASQVAQSITDYANRVVEYQPGTSFKKSYFTIHSQPISIGNDNLASILEKLALDLRTVLALIPPQHWVERFAASPGELIKATEDHDLQIEIITGWAQAALTYQATEWIASLLDWYASTLKFLPDQPEQALLASLPQEQQEQYILRFVAQSEYMNRCIPLVALLPAPWSESFSEQCLQYLKAYSADIYEQKLDGSTWNGLLRQACIALHPSCFDAALEPWPLPAKQVWNATYWKNQLDAFQEMIALRKQFHEEIDR